MSASPVSAPRRARRVARRGSVLGLGLAVVAGAAAPGAAVAEEETTTDVVPPVQPAPGEVQAAPALNEVPPPVSDPVFVAEFGMGKAAPQFPVTIAPHGSVPQDLDLSGAVLTLTALPGEGAAPDVLSPDEDAATVGCTTDATGTCLVVAGDEPASGPGRVTVPPGRYAVVQTGAVEGLTPAAGLYWTLEVCDASGDDPGSWFCGLLGAELGPAGRVPNDSQFVTRVTTTVLDGVTGRPVPGAAYRFTGPDHRHRTGGTPGDCGPTEPPAQEPTREPLDDTGEELLEPPVPPFPVLVGEPGVESAGTEDGSAAVEPAPVAEAADVAGSVVTGDDGVAVFTGCFLPGDWTLSPATLPGGHAAADVPVLLAPATRVDGTLTQAVETTVRLYPAAVATPETPPAVVTPAPVPPATPLPPAAAPSAPRAQGSGVAGRGTRVLPTAPSAAPPSAPAPAPAAASSTAPPSAAVPSTALPSTARATSAPRSSTATAPAAEAAPELRTESSSSLAQVGLVSFGITLVGVVFFLVLWLRRRARDARD